MQVLAFLSPHRRFVATAIAVFGSIILYYIFPVDDQLNPIFQELLLGLLFFVALPMLFVRIVLKEPIRSIGMVRSNRLFAWYTVPLVTIPALAVFYLLTRIYPVAENYFLPALVSGSFAMFLLYEIVLVGAVTFLYEVFFRGFVQLLWLGRYGLVSVFLQSVIFCVSMIVMNGATWQSAPLFLSSLSAGFVAFHTRSIWYSWAATWLILFLSDAYFVAIR